MNAKIFLTLLSLWVTLGATPAFACPLGNPDSVDYIRRDDNRCEGLVNRPISASIRLVSFSTGAPAAYPNCLTLRIPGINQMPQFKMQSFLRDYLLDKLSTTAVRFINNGMEYDLDTQPVLRSGKVPPNSLRAIAYITEKSEKIYYPVILNPSSEYYEFTLYVGGNARTTFPTLQIRKDGRVYHNIPQNNPKTGEVRFSWNFDEAPAGRYELYMVIKQQRPGQPQNNDTQIILFYHNPAWF
ncbi:MAG: hypothetical protein J7545_09805 [Roseofilum sp. SBFL]|uniref:hypothetical protein n=1 Tax=unclassified Roseofilum TaxID=2620099 RepID=UPI001B1FADE2|nr:MULTISPECIES: hypothetical protein [unclassified Roseofilum]MBP0015559.1 hypothetical protein [Roseofilum sp. SID3]MBP0022445.1 hypothetical protein [Roseofilum sp. SID2]MBP0036743.1 hypothetical protein [Roseofilum sp. SID1]MBP0042251.1 hypothetical protein [Roseofilum sp. SBFL]